MQALSDETAAGRLSSSPKTDFLNERKPLAVQVSVDEAERRKRSGPKKTSAIKRLFGWNGKAESELHTPHSDDPFLPVEVTPKHRSSLSVGAYLGMGARSEMKPLPKFEAGSRVKIADSLTDTVPVKAEVDQMQSDVEAAVMVLTPCLIDSNEKNKENINPDSVMHHHVMRQATSSDRAQNELITRADRSPHIEAFVACGQMPVTETIVAHEQVSIPLIVPNEPAEMQPQIIVEDTDETKSEIVDNQPTGRVMALRKLSDIAGAKFTPPVFGKLTSYSPESKKSPIIVDAGAKKEPPSPLVVPSVIYTVKSGPEVFIKCTPPSAIIDSRASKEPSSPPTPSMIYTLKTGAEVFSKCAPHSPEAKKSPVIVGASKEPLSSPIVPSVIYTVKTGALYGKFSPHSPEVKRSSVITDARAIIEAPSPSVVPSVFYTVKSGPEVFGKFAPHSPEVKKSPAMIDMRASKGVPVLASIPSVIYTVKSRAEDKVACSSPKRVESPKRGEPRKGFIVVGNNRNNRILVDNGSTTTSPLVSKTVITGVSVAAAIKRFQPGMFPEAMSFDNDSEGEEIESATDLASMTSDDIKAIEIDILSVSTENDIDCRDRFVEEDLKRVNTAPASPRSPTFQIGMAYLNQVDKYFRRSPKVPVTKEGSIIILEKTYTVNAIFTDDNENELFEDSLPLDPIEITNLTQGAICTSAGEAVSAEVELNVPSTPGQALLLTMVCGTSPIVLLDKTMDETDAVKKSSVTNLGCMEFVTSSIVLADKAVEEAPVPVEVVYGEDTIGTEPKKAEFTPTSSQFQVIIQSPIPNYSKQSILSIFFGKNGAACCSGVLMNSTCYSPFEGHGNDMGAKALPTEDVTGEGFADDEVEE